MTPGRESDLERTAYSTPVMRRKDKLVTQISHGKIHKWISGCLRRKQRLGRGSLGCFLRHSIVFLRSKLLRLAGILSNKSERSHARFLLIQKDDFISHKGSISPALCLQTQHELSIRCTVSAQDFNHDRHTGYKAMLNSEWSPNTYLCIIQKRVNIKYFFFFLNLLDIVWPQDPWHTQTILITIIINSCIQIRL